MPDAVVVVARGEVDGDQLGCGTSPAFGEHCRHGGVRAHLRVAVLHEQRGERGQVATRFGDLQRDVGRELERLAELDVSIARLDVALSSQGGQRAHVRVGVGLRER